MGHSVGFTRRAAACIVTAALALSLAGEPTAAGPEFGDVQLVDIDLGVDEFGNTEMLFGGGVSLNGRYAIITNGVGTFWHVDLTNNALTKLEVVDAVPSEDGQYVMGTDRNGGGERLREEVGSLDPQPYPFETIDIGLDPNAWYPARVINETDNERFALLSATTTDNFLTRYFVYDTVAGQLVTPLTGLPSPELNTSVLVFDATGTTVTYLTYCCAGANFATFERLDYLSGARTIVPVPAEHSPGLRNWTASPDLNWVLFSSDAAGVIAGLDATERVYRRNVATGVTDVVPIDFASISRLTSVDIFDTGRVIYTVDVPMTGDGPTEEFNQLFTWAGSSPNAERLSIGIDGQPARPFGVMGVSWSDDGSRVMFTSFATNLVAGVTMPDDLGDLVRRLYIVDVQADGGQTILGPAEATAPAVRCGPTC